MLTAKKYNDVVPGHANMIEFKLEKNEYQLIDIGADLTTISCLNKDNKEVIVGVEPDTVRAAPAPALCRSPAPAAASAPVL